MQHVRQQASRYTNLPHLHSLRFADTIHFGDYPSLVKSRFAEYLPVFTAEERALLKVRDVAGRSRGRAPSMLTLTLLCPFRVAALLCHVPTAHDCRISQASDPHLPGHMANNRSPGHRAPMTTWA